MIEGENFDLFIHEQTQAIEANNTWVPWFMVAHDPKLTPNRWARYSSFTKREHMRHVPPLMMYALHLMDECNCKIESDGANLDTLRDTYLTDPRVFVAYTGNEAQRATPQFEEHMNDFTARLRTKFDQCSFIIVWRCENPCLEWKTAMSNVYCEQYPLINAMNVFLMNWRVSDNGQHVERDSKDDILGDLSMEQPKLVPFFEQWL